MDMFSQSAFFSWYMLRIVYHSVPAAVPENLSDVAECVVTDAAKRWLMIEADCGGGALNTALRKTEPRKLANTELNNRIFPVLSCFYF